MSTPTAKRVLVVEDDPDMRQVLGELLASDGHRPLLAANGEEGLLILSRELPDLILLDMVMPRMDGDEFLKRLRANPKWVDIPVVATTALILPKKPAETVALLSKPFESKELSEVVSRCGR